MESSRLNNMITKEFVDFKALAKGMNSFFKGFKRYGKTTTC